MHHRTFRCPHTRSAVLEMVPAWLYAEGGRADPRSKFWSTGVFPHPADDWPEPAADFDAVIVGDDGGSSGLDGWHDPEAGFGGFVYTDGSCAHSPIRGLSRAACSSVQVDDVGNRTRGIYMPAPRHLPQSSQSGEHVGLALARRSAVRPADIGSDCLNVVRAATAPARLALAPTKSYAGIVMDQFTRADEVSKGTTVRWVRAHRADNESVDDATRRDIRGNAAADKLAGEAVSLHPQPTHDQRVSLEYYMKRAPLIARALGTALAMFPAAEEARLRRIDKPRDEDEAREKDQHFWSCNQGVWRCERCGTWTANDKPTARQYAEKCAGHIAHKYAREWSNLGHKVALAKGDAPFAFCSRCGAWGNRRARRLRLPCKGPSPAGSQALSRIAKGKHPWRLKLPSGGDAPPHQHRCHLGVQQGHQGLG